MQSNEAEAVKVLAADDDQDILDLVRFVLGRGGFDVTTAPDGQAALDLALEREFRLAVLDVRMPKMTGYEVVQRLRAEEGKSAMPVMLLSASVQDDQIARGLEVGADDYLRKPFSPKELLERVQALARR